MAIVKWDPFRDIVTLRDRMDRLFEDSMIKARGGEDEFGTSAWMPSVDIYETEKDLVIKAEIPGIDKKDVSINIKDNRLTLKGERKFEKDVQEESYHRMECSYGTFQRTFTLPTTVDQDKISANFKNGMIEVTLPKKEETKPKQIEIKG
ncbi:MAG: Hsp20/alpha crystallin family protein [bacterium]|nr:Hsp20/alpha crystallin family protein [bacterium]